MKKQLYEKWQILNKNLKYKLNVKTRKEKKMLWNTIKETVKHEYNPYHIFLEYKLRPYELEIEEIYEENMAIEKIKPYLLKYVIWRLYNPNNGIRFLNLKEFWNKRF